MDSVREYKLWETNIGQDKYKFFSNVDELFQYIQENQALFSYKIKNNYNIGNYEEDMLESIASRDNVNLIYVDYDHPIALSNDIIFSTYISKEFFQIHRKKFEEYELEKLKKAINEKSPFIYFTNITFNDELLDFIVNSNIGNSVITCREVDDNFVITEEQRKILKDHHIEFHASYRFKDFEQVSTNIIIGNYTFEELKTLHRVLINLPIEKSIIDNFVYINDNATIIFDGYERDKYDLNPNRNEIKYFNDIVKIMNQLSNHNKTYNIEIEVTNRQILEKSNLLKSIPSNVNITVVYERQKYDIETYIKEEEKLEKLVSDIKNSNLSPFEKCLACYNIAKKFKPYKENDDEKEKSRYLKYILQDDNEYIVCLGFSNLLKAILDRIGIPNQVIGVDVDISYDGGFSLEDKSLDMAGHARNLIKIDDDKYGIHGYYLADSTWDNSMVNDLYTNALLTFEQKKGSKRLERLDNNDLILDFSSKEDFIKKINYYLKREMNDQLHYKKSKQEAILYGYKEIYNKIINMLYYTNPLKYNRFYGIYEKYFKDRNIKLNDLEPIAYKFLDEYAEYVLPLSNNKVDFDKLLSAVVVVKKEVEKQSEEEIKEWLEVVKIRNQRQQERSFPYDYKINDNIQGMSIDIDEKNKK